MTKKQLQQELKGNHSNLLDTNLTLKHQSLKDWFSQYQQVQTEPEIIEYEPGSSRVDIKTNIKNF